MRFVPQVAVDTTTTGRDRTTRLLAATTRTRATTPTLDIIPPRATTRTLDLGPETEATADSEVSFGNRVEC